MTKLEDERTTATNTGLAKVAVQCSADTFVVNQTLVLRINICGENRHLRQARNRYAAVLDENRKTAFRQNHFPFRGDNYKIKLISIVLTSLNLVDPIFRQAH